MKIQFAKRIHSLKDSQTRAVDTTAKALKQQGIKVINLAAGEADFQTPENIKKAAIHAINEGFTLYTAPQGIIELRQALSEKLKRDNNLIYDPSEITVGVGGKQLLYAAFQVLCNKGDEVILPVPAWPSFVEQIKLAEAKPVLVKLKPPFQLTAKAVEKTITAKTKVLLLNSPANPTGAIIDEKELKKIADLAVKYKLWVISDEIYEKLVFEGSHISIASLNKKIKQRTITINGFSKAYAMTGWRIGYATGPKEVIEKITMVQNHIVTSVTSISQKAALAGLTQNQHFITTMQKEFKRRRDFFADGLSDIPGLSFVKPAGTFYFFVCVEKLLGKYYPTSIEWCKALLEKEHVAVVPGEAFSYPGYVRMSFSTSMEDLKEAIKRIKRFIKEKTQG